ncbi:efflux RND transporter periplasmic adaptor subunit [Ferrimonas lipolytica]|uniref:Efflux RND transporter periplasmic adaptor subunit n=1 Tax=Ferrimonas lipolytica TaxID=2724191 RepID=A0A6H1UCQ2_9GAMM|nr:efflux RND transporter periplasmic adaptor subunit [Ferrimonas lipolytica]QIZ76419.1 efflux RND transporter periplasmic adaptor subunit [Ferrimonas lipolytica]
MHIRNSIRAVTALPFFVIAGYVTPALAADTPVAAVTVATATMREVTPSTGFSGRVEAVNTVSLKARVAGYLEGIHYIEGAEVEAGQLLFSIEKGQYQAQVDAIKGSITSLDGTTKLAAVEKKRFAKLLKTNVASQDDFDKANAALIEATGSMQSQQANLQKAELDLSYTDISAPVAGRISRSAYDPGDYLNPLSGDLATIVSQDPIYVTFPVTQLELLQIRKESSAIDSSKVAVKVEMADGTEYDQTGVINYIDVTSNPSTDTTLVRAEFPNPQGLLVDQQLVNVKVESTNAELKLMVPQRSIQLDQVGSYVMMVDGSNIVQQQRITTGTVIGTNVVILKGLNEGDKVIIAGIQKVRPGVTVNPTTVTAD